MPTPQRRARVDGSIGGAFRVCTAEVVLPSGVPLLIGPPSNCFDEVGPAFQGILAAARLGSYCSVSELMEQITAGHHSG